MSQLNWYQKRNHASATSTSSPSLNKPTVAKDSSKTPEQSTPKFAWNYRTGRAHGARMTSFSTKSPSSRQSSNLPLRSPLTKPRATTAKIARECSFLRLNNPRGTPRLTVNSRSRCCSNPVTEVMTRSARTLLPNVTKTPKNPRCSAQLTPAPAPT